MKKFELGAAIACLVIALLDYLPDQTWTFFRLGWRNARVFPTISMAMVGAIIMLSLYKRWIKA